MKMQSRKTNSQAVPVFHQKPKYWPSNISFDPDIKLLKGIFISPLSTNARYAFEHLYELSLWKWYPRIELFHDTIRLLFHDYGYEIIEMQSFPAMQSRYKNSIPIQIPDDGSPDAPIGKWPHHLCPFYSDLYAKKQLSSKSKLPEDVNFYLQHMIIHGPAEYGGRDAAETYSGNWHGKMTKRVIANNAILYYFAKKAASIVDYET